jgi:uncharacterized membrane protein YraQ (UPF0718 family)
MQNLLSFVLTLLQGGWASLVDYLSAHVLMCLVPAFFIAGAMSALIPQEAITKYLGRAAKPWVAYPAAAASGFLLAVCSCTILPLFAGIWKRGAGLGPAITFLFVGPAVNILALTYTGGLIGMDIALARAVLAVGFGLLIGMLMAWIFRKEEANSARAAVAVTGPARIEGRILGFFALLVAILLLGTARIDVWVKNGGVVALAIGTVATANWGLTRHETRMWLAETWKFTKQIFPLLIGGVFLAGMVKVIVPPELVRSIAGSNTLPANLAGVLFGVFMYFPTLMEVPIARTFLELGMARGPLLAYLLADPELSIQSILVTNKLLGWKKNALYVGLVTLLTTLAGWIFGMALAVMR